MTRIGKIINELYTQGKLTMPEAVTIISAVDLMSKLADSKDSRLRAIDERHGNAALEGLTTLMAQE
jgi:hypothetical protein